MCLKIAFVTHDVGIYGAAKSLKEMLELFIDNAMLERKDIILITNKHFFKNIKVNNFSEYKREEILLPFSNCYVGREKYTLKKFIRNVLSFMTLLFKWRKIETQLVSKGYEYIHLNSLVLWPVLLFRTKRIKYIIHIRELPHDKYLFAQKMKKTIKNKADHIYCVDNKIYKHFTDSEKSLLLINPASRFFLEEKEKATFKEKLKQNTSFNEHFKTVSIIGRVEKIKGHDFLFETIKEYDINDINVLVVGNFDTPWGKEQMNIVRNFKNIIFLGEFDNVGLVYAISDAVVRCENYFALGRTVLEGLFNNCKIIMPYETDEDLDFVNKELNRFINRFLFYKAGNKYDFYLKLKEFKAVDNIETAEEKDSQEINNYTEYTKKFFSKLMADS